MIERVLIKNCLTFQKVELKLDDGLIAFTGESGAGKSVLINALLTLFAFKDSEAKLIECSLSLPLNKLKDMGIDEEEPNVIRFIKDKKARYFINSQALSKKNLQLISEDIIRYLSVNQNDEFTSDNLISLLDLMIIKKEKQYQNILENYKDIYKKYIKVKDELFRIGEEEKKIDELREFAKYEVQTIESIGPKIGEYEQLLETKKSLSKKEKISQAIERANSIFEYENAVNEFLNLSEIDSTFFDECMNDLRAFLEESSLKLDELDDMNIETLLERLEQLSKLKNRFGGIEESLEYKEKKLQEIKYYENISYEKSELEKKFKAFDIEIKNVSESISKRRKKELNHLETLINSYLEKLYLSNAKLTISSSILSILGMDEINLTLNQSRIKEVSSGELNRLRLAFIATKNELLSEKNSGILILDEIDANLSGKEAMSIANVLKEISKSYQVIAISHQPQLSSLADQHFLVEKKDGKSSVRMLSKNERINELARMVSGEIIQSEALEFAKKLLE